MPAARNLDPEAITEEDISRRLYTAGQPDPDLIMEDLRPAAVVEGDVHRDGGVVLAPLLGLDDGLPQVRGQGRGVVLWPDFTPEHLNYALHQYALRDRRYGGV